MSQFIIRQEKRWGLTMEKTINFKEVEPNYFEAVNISHHFIKHEIFKIAQQFTGTHDILFYNRLRAELKHLWYKYENNLLKSHRNIFITSDECITTIQFLWHDNVLYCNVYSRSCNYKESYNEDIGFICDYLTSLTGYKHIMLRYFIGSLHYWSHND